MAGRKAGQAPGTLRLPILMAAPRPASCSAVRHLRPAIAAMAGYTPGEQVLDCIKLNTNESARPPGPKVMEALQAITADRLRLYPDPRATELRRVAAATYGVTPEQILAGNGSDDCLTILYRAFLAPGDRVAAPWPTYGLYDDLATLQGAEMIHVDWRFAADGWHLPEALATVGAKLVLLANPNNPSGTLVPVADLRRLAERLDGILVVDEAYVDFAPEGSSFLPFLDAHPNVVVLRTFSKSYSLAGGRLGLLFAHPDLVAHLTKVKDSYNVNHVTQRLGIAALQDAAWLDALVAGTVAERKRLETLVASHGWTWVPTAANFLLCEVGPRAEAIYLALKERRLLVRWWNKPLLNTKLRITVGTPEQTDRLAAELKSIV